MDMLNGGEQNDTLKAAPTQTLWRGAPAVTFSSEAAATICWMAARCGPLDGGAGNDLLTEGPGAELFTWGIGSGDDTTQDFDPGTRLDIIGGPDWKWAPSWLNGEPGDIVPVSNFEFIMSFCPSTAVHISLAKLTKHLECIWSG